MKPHNAENFRIKAAASKKAVYENEDTIKN